MGDKYFIPNCALTILALLLSPPLTFVDLFQSWYTYLRQQYLVYSKKHLLPPMSTSVYKYLQLMRPDSYTGSSFSLVVTKRFFTWIHNHTQSKWWERTKTHSSSSSKKSKFILFLRQSLFPIIREYLKVLSLTHFPKSNQYCSGLFQLSRSIDLIKSFIPVLDLMAKQVVRKNNKMMWSK